MTDQPVEVTVIIAIGKGADRGMLAEQLAAVVPQLAAARAELLISDNGFGLEPGDPLLASPAVRVVDSSHVFGAGPARNVVAPLARGALLVFCDADDIAAPDWLREMVRATEQHELAGGRLEYLRLNTPELARWNHQTTRELPSKFGYLPFAPTANLAIRADTYRAVGGFDTTLLHGEDIDLCWRAQRAGARIAFAPDAVMHYRLRTDLKGLWRQAKVRGRHDAELLRHHRAHGARRSPRSTVEELASIGISAAQATVFAWARPKLVFRLGGLAGRIVGSVRDRAWAV